MIDPIVTVVIPTRNRVDLLRHAVASVMHQTEPNFELIVVDDGSADATPAYLAELVASEARVRVVRNATARGGAAARNAGIASARARWVAFLDDDDEWLPVKLRRQLDLLAADDSAVACSCHYIHSSVFGRSAVVSIPSELTPERLLFDNPLGSASLCVASTRVLRQIGGFDSRLRSCQDQDIWLRLFAAGPILVCNEPLVRYRSHHGPRISNDFRSQHAGARRFFFKHRAAMDAAIRRRRVAFSCFLMSRQSTKTIRRRARYLAIAARNARLVEALRYLRSSGTRLLFDTLRRKSTTT
jgi:glycosyltransferase involved in cell wall biosynthesis